MTLSFANRLAGGGYWAICIADLARQMTGHLNEQGLKPPVGDGSPAQVFVHCGVSAFELICNLHMKEAGGAMHVTIEAVKPPPTYNRQGERIPLELWQKLHDDDMYKRVAKWENDCGGNVHVSTIWTGLDPSGRGEIFETATIGLCEGHYHVGHIVRTSTEAEAVATHNAVVAAVRGGFI
jgi:hypothetical protein